MLRRRGDLPSSNFNPLIRSILCPAGAISVIALGRASMQLYVTHVGTGPLPGFHQALISERLQRAGRRGSRHVPFLCDLPLGWDLRAWRKVSPDNLVTEVACDLEVLGWCLLKLRHRSLSGCQSLRGKLVCTTCQFTLPASGGINEQRPQRNDAPHRCRRRWGCASFPTSLPPTQ